MIRKPTLRDVADLAAVSLGTASNALTSKPNVRDEVRQRVEEAAASIGYRHTPRARTSTVVGVIGKLDDGVPMMLNAFYSNVLASIERESNRLRMSVMFSNLEVDRLNRPLDLPPMLMNKQVDGLLIVGTFLSETLHLISEETTKPIVLIDAYAPHLPCDSVLIDNQRSAEEAVRYLQSQGHEHIGLVGSSAQSYPSIQERRQGYLRVMKERRTSTLYIAESVLTREAAYAATCDLLKRAPEVTALFACNDEMAIAAMNAARDCGRDVPGDLSIIGFDDIDMASQMTPALTTMAIDRPLLGALGVQYLHERMANPQRSTLTTRIAARLQVRKSVAPRGLPALSLGH